MGPLDNPGIYASLKEEKGARETSFTSNGGEGEPSLAE